MMFIAKMGLQISFHVNTVFSNCELTKYFHQTKLPDLVKKQSIREPWQRLKIRDGVAYGYH